MKIQPQAVAVITGAGSGIGRALALNLARRGCALALADINPSELKETAEMVRSTAYAVTTHCVDVAQRDAVEQFAAAVVEAHGAAHLVFNNAGVAVGASVEDMSLENLEWLLSINFWGVVYGVKFFLPILKKQPEAHIINTSSLFGLMGPGQVSAYVASKFAVRGFTESLRMEMTGSSVHVSCVHPGGIKTNIALRARMEGGSPEQQEKNRVAFNNTLVTTPEKAAAIILRGVERNKARILVGPDAKVADAILRFAPVRGPLMLERAVRRMSGVK